MAEMTNAGERSDPNSMPSLANAGARNPVFPSSRPAQLGIGPGDHPKLGPGPAASVTDPRAFSLWMTLRTVGIAQTIPLRAARSLSLFNRQALARDLGCGSLYLARHRDVLRASELASENSGGDSADNP